MRAYEVIVTFDPDIGEDGVTEQLGKLRDLIASFDGKVLQEENSGKQPLVYPMKKKTYGTYVLLIIEANPEFVAEFTRVMRINDAVLRFMAVRREEGSGDSIKREERSSRPSGGRDRYNSRDKSDRGDRKDKSSTAAKSSDDDSDTNSESSADKETESAAEAAA